MRLPMVFAKPRWARPRTEAHAADGRPQIARLRGPSEPRVTQLRGATRELRIRREKRHVLPPREGDVQRVVRRQRFAERPGLAEQVTHRHAQERGAREPLDLAPDIGWRKMPAARQATQPGEDLGVEMAG
jgi:hypothetical protein